MVKRAVVAADVLSGYRALTIRATCHRKGTNVNAKDSTMAPSRPPERPRRTGPRGRLRSLDRSELLDSLAEGPLGKLLRFPGFLQERNAQLTVAHEVTRMLAHAFAYARSEEVEGDYAEFGIWRGRTFVEAYRVARKYPRYARRFFAFDSFEGLPEIQGEDASSSWYTGEFAVARAAFEARLKRARVPESEVTIVEGFFDKTLSAPDLIPLERVAVAWVDCDLYESTVPVLDYLTDRLVPGAVLVFDDWFCFRGARDRGESRACAEWLERNPHITLVPWRTVHWAGQAFLVQRAD